MLYTYLSKGTIYVTYRKKKNTRSSRREKFLYFIKTLNEVTSSSPTYDISYYIQFKIEFKDDILFNKTTTDNPRHVTLFVGVQYLTAESIKMHNKTSLFKINQSRVNPLRNIYSSAKKKKYPSHRDNSTFAHSAKKSSPFQQLYLHSPSTGINSKYRSFESVVHLFPLPLFSDLQRRSVSNRNGNYHFQPFRQQCAATGGTKSARSMKWRV